MNRLLMAKIFHLCVACTDAGEGREQDAASFVNLAGSATIGGVSRPVYTVTERFNLMISSTQN